MELKREESRSLINFLNLQDFSSKTLSLLDKSETKYLKDLKMNIKTALKSDNMDDKEIALLGVSLASNNQNKILLDYFVESAKNNDANNNEIGEAVAIASLLSANNVLYRFRHFMQKESYNNMPAKLRMNIMMNPVVGKELFELLSLAVSSVNGCELCVSSHESSLLALETSEERIFDAVRLASVIESISKIIN